MDWQLQEAKARLSELVRKAQTEGPQAISVHGRPAVVVVSSEEFAQLVKPRPGFVEFLRRSPLAGSGVGMSRESSPPRKVEL